MKAFDVYYNQFVSNKPYKETLRERLDMIMASIFDADPTINSILIHTYTRASISEDGEAYVTHHQDHCVGTALEVSYQKKYYSEQQILQEIIDPLGLKSLMGLEWDLPCPNPPDMHIKAKRLVEAVSNDIRYAFGENQALAWLREPLQVLGFRFFETYVEPDC